MTRTIPARQRQPTHRTRTGCLRCKSKRVKCSERRPVCERCERWGVECRYSDQASKEREPTRQSLLAPQKLPTAPLVAQPFPIKMMPKDVTYFDQFRHEVVHQFSRQGIPDFWLRTALRESMRDEGIYHCVIGIGALNRSNSYAPSNVPLFKADLSQNTLANTHYAEAVKSYVKALSVFRTRLSTNTSLPRTILIYTILFLVFETLQGNTESTDQIIAQGLNVFKDILLRTPLNRYESLIAAPLDDEGVQDAEFWFTRSAVYNVLYSPMYPASRQSILQCNFSSAQFTNLLEATGVDMEFWVKFYHCTTICLACYQRITNRPVLELSADEVSLLQQEQIALVTHIACFSQAMRQRILQESDSCTRRNLDHSLQGLVVFEISTRCCLDTTGLLWEAHKGACLQVLQRYRSMLVEEPLLLVGRTITFEGILAPMLQLARECQDYDVRTAALDLCKCLVSSFSSWDLKGILMGTSALLEAEEAFRDQAGRIPWSKRYDWIGATWSLGYDEYYITLKRRLAGSSSSCAEKQVTLRPEDFGLN